MDRKDSVGGSKWARFKRPPVEFFSPLEKDILFQFIDIDFSLESSSPIVRMFGVTLEGHSVCCSVHGFYPYFYILAPKGFTSDDCRNLRDALNRSLTSYFNGHIQYTISVDLVLRKNIMGYSENGCKYFCKVNFSSPLISWKIASLLKDGLIEIPGFGFYKFEVYESTVPFTTRFLVDLNLVGCCWIKINSGQYKLLAPCTESENFSLLKTSCQLEISVHFNHFRRCYEESMCLAMSHGIRIMSFDIECVGNSESFPHPDHDSIILISSVLVEFPSYTPIIKAVFTLGSCDEIDGVVVMECKSEQNLISTFCSFVREIDPDIVTGYNILNFDLWYLLSRTIKLDILDSFQALNRDFCMGAEAIDKLFLSSKLGNHQIKELRLKGRVIFDVFRVVKKQFDLELYSLKYVSLYFLDDYKYDVLYSDIPDLQMGDRKTRKRLAMYCLKDSTLPLDLIDRLRLLINAIEMSRVTGASLSTTSSLKRGSQKIIYALVLRKAKANGFILPDFESKYSKPIFLDRNKCLVSAQEVIAKNICYSTFIIQEKGSLEKGMSGIPVPQCFVQSNVLKGLIPGILEELYRLLDKSRKTLNEECNTNLQIIFSERILLLDKIIIDLCKFNYTNELGILPFPKLNNVLVRKTNKL